MKKGAFSHIDPWYPIFKGEGKEYAEQMKNIFLGLDREYTPRA